MLQRATTPDGVVLYVSPLLRAAGVPHAFSTRHGGISAAPFDSTMKWGPLDPNQGETASNQLQFFIDGRRHGPPNASRKKQYESSYVNMLFVDGHASSVTVREAYNAVRYPGENKAGQ